MEKADDRPCLVCGRISADGWAFMESRLCSDCVSRIQNTLPDDAGYGELVERIGMFWKRIEKENPEKPRP